MKENICKIYYNYFMIYLHEPNTSNEEVNLVLKCFKENNLAFGKYINLFEKKIQDILNVNHAIACVNGTSALQLSLRLLNLDPNSEVIVPSLTFISPINAIKYNNLNPIFVDSDKHLNIDQEKVIDFLKNCTSVKFDKTKNNYFTINRKNNKKISAIIIIHTFGNPAKFDKLFLLCKKLNIKIIEDNAESLGAYYKSGNFKNKFAGTIGDLGCLSFNGNKIITSAGGGMIITNKSSYAKKARYLINQAKDNSIDFVHKEIGYNFRISNVHAAIGYAQTKKLKKFIKKKKLVHDMYRKYLSNCQGIKLQASPIHAESNYWLNIAFIEFKKFKISKKILMEKMNKKNIQIRPIWKLNHTQKPYIKYQKYKIENSKSLFNNSVCLPSSVNLQENQIKKISREIIKLLNAS